MISLSMSGMINRMKEIVNDEMCILSQVFFSEFLISD
jgi:hypothetical protein